MPDALIGFFILVGLLAVLFAASAGWIWLTKRSKIARRIDEFTDLF